jgi:hypothetical protein
LSFLDLGFLIVPFASSIFSWTMTELDFSIIVVSVGLGTIYLFIYLSVPYPSSTYKSSGWSASCIFQNANSLKPHVNMSIHSNKTSLSWQSVFLVEETRVNRDNRPPVPTYWQTFIYKVVRCTLHFLIVPFASSIFSWTMTELDFFIIVVSVGPGTRKG